MYKFRTIADLSLEWIQNKFLAPGKVFCRYILHSYVVLAKEASTK